MDQIQCSKSLNRNITNDISIALSVNWTIAVEKTVSYSVQTYFFTYVIFQDPITTPVYANVISNVLPPEIYRFGRLYF